MGSDRNERTAVVPLLVFSVVFLALEILLTRILAYSVHTILLYTVLGIAMLGTGAAGSLVAVRYDWVDRERIAGSLAWAATVASLSVPLCLAAFVRCTPYLGPTNPSAFLIATLLTFPFLCAGVVITLALTSAGPEIGRCYAANLIGSGLGCFLPVLLLGPLDGEQMLGLLSALSWVAALLYAARVPTEARGRLRGALAVSPPRRSSIAGTAPAAYRSCGSRSRDTRTPTPSCSTHRTRGRDRCWRAGTASTGASTSRAHATAAATSHGRAPSGCTARATRGTGRKCW